MNTKILLVDDDENVLQGFKRHLRKKYDLELAVGGDAALQTIRENGPFAVVVSDMQMPKMSGVELLRQIREINEHTVRIMLTGNADQKTAVDAVNDGHIFRFLNKPCPPETLAVSLDAGLNQYRLVTAEAELLDKTLSGSVCMLTQVLSLAMPEAFGLTQEARKWAHAIASNLKISPMWQVEVSAMLMRIGCVSLPKPTLDSYLAGGELSEEDGALVRETPQMAHALLSAIPRLEDVAEFILFQNEPPEEPTPVESRIIRVIGDYQRFRTNDSRTAFERLSDTSTYDPEIVNQLTLAIDETRVSKRVELNELRTGMVLSSNIEDRSGRMLIAAGMEIHPAIIQKLSLLERTCGVQTPIEVQMDGTDESDVPVNAASVAHEMSTNLLQLG